MKAKKKSKIKGRKKKSKPVSSHGQNKNSGLDWVSRLDFQSLEPSSIENEESIAFRIVSWNVLAEAYTRKQSQRCLPEQYNRTVFTPKRRRLVLQERLRQLASMSDILCLQEVDMPLVRRTLNEMHFQATETPIHATGELFRRIDGCGVYFLQTKWKLISQDIERLDNLARLGAVNSSGIADSPFQSIQQSFLRGNVAIFVRLQHLVSKKQILVVNTHLYWNPVFDFVKLLQAHHVLLKAKNFHQPNEPIFFCGDLNSPVDGPVYHYLTKGHIDPRILAPWCKEQFPSACDSGTSIEEQMEALQLDSETRQPRYLVDFQLKRLAEWFRMLGIDAELTQEDEEQRMTSRGKLLLFGRCREERRSLITTSSVFVSMKDCPSGTYFISPKKIDQLEMCLVHILLTHGVVLRPKKFLRRCVSCNRALSPSDETSGPAESYQCNACRHCPSRNRDEVKQQAKELFETCLRAGVPIDGPLGLFETVDIAGERSKGLDEDAKLERLQVIEWLKQERLECPLHLQSSQRAEGGEGESINFSTVTSDFVALLDYVMFSPDSARATARLSIPVSFGELNERGIRNGHLLPSNIWPSDHLAIGAEFGLNLTEKSTSSSLPSEDSSEVSSEGTSEDLWCRDLSAPPPPPRALPVAHKPRCDCGCVPPTPSLFEMAELRKKEKLRKQKAALEWLQSSKPVASNAV